MTFAELLRATVELRPQDNVCIEVRTWHYDDGRERLEWDIWSGALREHFVGASAEDALTALKGYIATKENVRERAEAITI